MTTTVDRTREIEAYDLRRAQATRGVIVDCPTGRLLAVALAAVGCPSLLLERAHGGRADWASYLLPAAADRAHGPATAFAVDVVPRWFADAHITPMPLPADEPGLLTFMRRAGASPLLLVPLEAPTMVELAYQAVESGEIDRRHVRIVATGPRGCAIVIPDPDSAEAQVEAMAAVLGGDGGDDPRALDASLIAAGMLVHEARLLAGAGLPKVEERPADDVCALTLPEPPARGATASLCVGAGGIGAILALMGIGPAARTGDRLTLVDGDVVAGHNLLLQRWQGRTKVVALQRELLASCDALEVEVIARMVEEGTRLPTADAFYAVTDSVHSRLLTERALPDGAGPLVCAGSSLDGAEAFLAGGGPACVACRYPPAALAAPAGAECARNPALFASNMIAAGLALALGRRAGSEHFLQGHDGACRYRATTLRGDRFVADMPQRCTHR